MEGARETPSLQDEDKPPALAMKGAAQLERAQRPLPVTTGPLRRPPLQPEGRYTTLHFGFQRMRSGTIKGDRDQHALDS